MRKSAVAAAVLTFVVGSFFAAQACGPDFEPDVFVRKMRPDNPKEYALGKIGILLPTYPREELVVAFRYLNGGKLSGEEQRAYVPIFNYEDPEWRQEYTEDASTDGKKPPTPSEVWKAARAGYGAPAPELSPQREVQKQVEGGGTYTESYANCNDDAFRNATLTLQSRAKAWGEKSADIADWIKGQDAVFSNCKGGPAVIPAGTPAGGSALLKADRAYQAAAAEFYALKFEEARAGFEAIAKDGASPWHGIAGYLAARCLVRDAFQAAPAADETGIAKFDEPKMRQAAAVLTGLLKEPHEGISQRAVQAELDLVQIRIEPLARLKELGDALAGPGTDSEYAQHLKDLDWYLDSNLDTAKVREDSFFDPQTGTPEIRAKAFSGTWKALADLRSSAPMVDWLITMQSPAAETGPHALEEWKKTRQTYWLLAALAKAKGTEADAKDLVQAAGAVAADSPAWEMATYERIRLMAGMGRGEEAKKLLAEVMPAVRAGGRDSSINQFLELRARVATSLPEFLTYAPRKVMEDDSEEASSLRECLEVMKDPKRKYDCGEKVGPLQFSADAAGFLNEKAPVEMLASVANSSLLPEDLRRSVAMTAWVRAVLLKDDADAAKVFGLLPAKLQEQAGSGTGFQALMALVRNPGLRPFLDAGMQRSYSWDFVESYADNWWCKDWRTGVYGPERSSSGTYPMAFLTEEQRARAGEQFTRLSRQDGAEIELGGQVLAYARAHPEDKDAPEALFLVLRMIRYGCNHGGWDDSSAAKDLEARVGAVQKEAARLLRQRYATSPWTKKAAPFAG